MEIVLVKLGGSIITDKEKPYTARLDNISRFADEIFTACKADPNLKLIIANGSGSFGHTAAHECNVEKEGIDSKAASHIRKAADKINRIMLDSLMKAGIKTESITISDWAQIKKNRVKLNTKSIEACLDAGLVPLLHGDVVKDDNKAFSILSGESIFAAIIEAWQKQKKYKAKKIIMVGEVAGVLNNRKQIIAEITENNFPEVKEAITTTKGIDVTGGMLHKIEMSLRLAQQGVETFIISGEKDMLEKALLDEKVIGTRIS